MYLYHPLSPNSKGKTIQVLQTGVIFGEGLMKGIGIKSNFQHESVELLVLPQADPLGGWNVHVWLK